MALAEVQAALARLFTDDSLRAAFLRDPQSAARALGLDEPDAATLSHLAPQAVRQFAGSLSAKRVLDMCKTTPLTARALGAAFAGHLHAAIAASPPADRAGQARALGARLSALAKSGDVEPEWIGDLARYEAAFAAVSGNWFGVKTHVFGFPVGEVAFLLHTRAAIGAIAPRATLGVWARLPGRRLFHRLWPLAPERRRQFQAGEDDGR